MSKIERKNRERIAEIIAEAAIDYNGYGDLEEETNQILDLLDRGRYDDVEEMAEEYCDEEDEILLDVAKLAAAA